MNAAEEVACLGRKSGYGQNNESDCSRRSTQPAGRPRRPGTPPGRYRGATEATEGRMVPYLKTWCNSSIILTLCFSTLNLTRKLGPNFFVQI